MTSIRADRIFAAATQLRSAQENGAACAPLSQDLPGEDVALAYAIQNVNTDFWLAGGRRLSGRKIGLTSRAVQAQFGVSQPDYGMLFADMAFSDGEELPMDRLLQPRVEGEIAFVLGRDLDREGLTPADVMAAIDYAVAAIEVVDSRITDWRITIGDTIADNASSGLYVLGGAPRRLADFDTWACGMVIEHLGEPVSTGAGAACLGHPLTSCLWLARKMVEVGRPLRAGDTVLSGALGPVVPAVPGGSYELRIKGLGSVRANFSA